MSRSASGTCRSSATGSRSTTDVLRVRRPPTSEISRLLAKAADAAPTYPEVGATRSAQLPNGYRHDRYKHPLGHGDAVFARAVEALSNWRAHFGAGAQVFPTGARVDEASTVVLLIRVSGLWATLPCRVVYVDETPERFGFAYGTLPGHPETGEVEFRVDRDDESGEIVFRIVSFSRTVDPLARLASPVTRWIQQRVTKRYMRVIAEITS
jgi:uncharacterized protein (UPF0548 family)